MRRRVYRLNVGGRDGAPSAMPTIGPTMAATLFDQWVGRAPSASDLEARGTNPTHLSDRASAVPQVSTVLGDGESATYYDAEKRTRAFLRDNGVDVDHYGFPTDEAPHDTHEHPTNIMMARGVMSAIYDDTPAQTSIDLMNHDEGFIIGGTTGSSVDASDPAAMEWPTLMYAVSHDEQSLPCATAVTGPITLTRTNMIAIGSQPFTIDPNGSPTVIRIDRDPTRRASKRKLVEGRKPRGEERDKRNRSKVAQQESDSRSNAKKAHCRECKRTRKQDERTKDRPLCTPCANEAFATLSTTIRT